MTDQPLFEVDDTTTSYSPPRAVRPRWVERGRVEASGGVAGTPVTTQHWFDPQAGRARPADGRDGTGEDGGSRGVRPRRPLLLVAMAIAVVSAVIAAAVTVGLLAAGGWLGERDTSRGVVTRQPSPSPTIARQVITPDTRRIATEVGPAVVTVVVAGTDGVPLTKDQVEAGTTAAVASGIVYDDGGWILTNRHVVCEAGSIAVLFADGRMVAAQVYGLDSLTDLAIIRVDATGLTKADIGDSASLRPGQASAVVATSAERLVPIVTSATVHAVGRDLVIADPCLEGERRAIRNVIQTDARSGAGIAGGALVDAGGAVVGINTYTSEGRDGVAFAIPINIAKPIMEQAVEGKPLSRPWMGITYTALNADIAAAYGLTIDHGAWLRSSADGSLPAVVPGGPADQAGLREGDILTAIDDQRIDSAHTLDEVLSQYRPEDQDPIEVSLLRAGAPLDRTLTLGMR